VSGATSSDDVTSVTTRFIPIECDAIEMQKAIEAMGYVGNVAVTKRALPQCSADGTGCGTNSLYGYGSVYQVQRAVCLRCACSADLLLDAGVDHLLVIAHRRACCIGDGHRIYQPVFERAYGTVQPSATLLAAWQLSICASPTVG
jgi:hypothetical protein